MCRIPNHKKVPNFVGRMQILSEIRQRFSKVSSGGTDTPVSLGLVGMGGIGKTQIALEFCRQEYQKKHFDSVFWFTAQSAETVVAEFIRLFKFPGLPNQDSLAIDEKVDAVLASFNTWPQPYLLVYDNFDNPNFDDILRYVPFFGPGAILLTSRLLAAGNLLNDSIPVDVMTDDEALHLLRSRSGLKDSLVNRDEDGKLIVQLLDRLPLAIDQAGAYLKGSSNSVSFKTFPDHYERRKRMVLDETPTFWQYRAIAEENEKARCLSVFTTWELSLNLLGSDRKDRQKKIDFLTLAAYLGGDRVSDVFFSTYVTSGDEDRDLELYGSLDMFLDGQAFDDSRYRECLMELTILTLIRSFAETDFGSLHFSMHSLVQDWIKLRLEAKDRTTYTSHAISLMTSFLESDVGSSLQILKIVRGSSTAPIDSAKFGSLVGEMIAEIVMHVRACLLQGQEQGLLPSRRGRFERHCAKFPEDAGDINLARSLWEALLERTQKELGQQGGETLVILSIICGLRAKDKLKAEARESTEVLHAQLQTIKGANHMETLMVKYQLCELYVEIGHMERTRSMALQLKDSEHICHISLNGTDNTIILALGIAQILLSLSLLDGVESIVERVLDVIRHRTRSIKPSTIERFARATLCKLRLAQNLPAEAERVCWRIIQSFARRPGDDSLEIMLLRGDALASCLAYQERLGEAAVEAEKLFNYTTSAIGIEHPLCRPNAIALAEYWYNAGPKSPERSQELTSRLLDKHLETHTPDDRETVLLQRSIAELYFRTKRYRLSLSLAKQLCQTTTASLAPEDYLRISVEDDLALCLCHTTDRSEAEICAVLDLLRSRFEQFEARCVPLRTG